MIPFFEGSTILDIGIGILRVSSQYQPIRPFFTEGTNGWEPIVTFYYFGGCKPCIYYMPMCCKNTVWHCRKKIHLVAAKFSPQK